uniref:Arf-GAP domain-containing protein n=1 Tax=Sinocyclocheilus anshuiensis TaxID=1608454 RepID=A0A671NUV5_9TELE
MRNSIAEALSNYEVAERIWAEPSNQMCADCSDAKPEWAAINLAVVFCKRCAGEHRGLGPSISKVRSLKMDKKVWSEDLIQVCLVYVRVLYEALTLNSSSEERRRFITAKYLERKHQKYTFKCSFYSTVCRFQFQFHQPKSLFLHFSSTDLYNILFLKTWQKFIYFQ